MSARTPTAEPETVKESTPLAANSPLPVAATRIEAEIDTALAELHRQHDVAAAKAQSALDSLHYVAGDRPRYRTRTIREWGMTREAVLAFVPPANAPWKVAEHSRSLASYQAAVAESARLSSAIEEQNKLYTGWSRFFLVTQANGHIHNSMGCSTCYPTTQFSWLPTLSGLTEADAVAEHGPRLCSVCFPSAPVEWTLGVALAKAYCDGSGSFAATNRRYAKCPNCGKAVAVTPRSGSLRKHKAAA